MTARALTRDLPPVLGKLIPRLSSPFDAERLATVAAIDKALKAANRDWHDVASATTAQAPPSQWSYEPQHCAESDDARQMREWLTAISRENWLNAWTAGFVADLLRRPSLDGLTGKQLACVNRIIRQAQDRGVCADRRAA